MSESVAMVTLIENLPCVEHTWEYISCGCFDTVAGNREGGGGYMLYFTSQRTRSPIATRLHGDRGTL